MVNTPSDVPAGYGLIPIVVGVTGHRDFLAEDRECLEVSVRGALKRLQHDHPHSPCVLLSALAEGADRLAVHVALALGWQVGAVLPFSPEDYENDFGSKDSIEEFRFLLSRAAWMKVVTPSTATLGALSQRERGYFCVGMEIARESQILLALWDGESERKPGGTTDVVLTFLEGVPAADPDREALMVPDSGPVWQIFTRRSGSPSPAEGVVGQLQEHAPSPGGLAHEGEAERWQTILRRIEQFNSDAAIAIHRNKEAIRASKSYLGAAELNASESANRAAWLFAVADQMSVETQTRRASRFMQMIGVGVVAIFFEQLYSGPFFDFYWLLLALLAGGIGFQLFRGSVHDRLEERYLDYRALAEACRVQYFWKIICLPDCVSQFFLRGQRDELEWIRRALITTELGGASGKLNDVDEKQCMEHLIRCWIQDQRHYFVGLPDKGQGNKAEFNERQATRWGRYGTRFFVSAIIAMAILLGLHSAFQPDPDNPFAAWLQYIIVAYGMLFAGAGVVFAYSETHAYSEQARRYRRMGISMTMASKTIGSALNDNDFGRARMLVKAVGQEALSEIGDWLLLHRDRPAKVPIG